MHLRPMEYVLWFASPALQAGVVIAMLRRGLHRDYPYFFNYTILGVIAEPLLFVLHLTSYTSYYYAYYGNLGLSVIFSFAVLQEIFRDAFRPYEALRDLSVILFRWSALVVLLVAVAWAISSGSGGGKPDTGFMEVSLVLADRSVRLMQCGLVFFLLLFSEYLGIPRRSFLFGISLGFGLFASVNMLVFTGLYNRSGVISRTTLSEINSGAYVAAVLIWFGYTLASAPSRSMVEEITLQRSKNWNLALEDARGPVVADSLLDTMDRTVERLLYPPEESPVKITAEHS
jgi:hypothetical protein